ncbi:cupin [Chryseobacterium soli]|uniref:Cupin n=1 Tax=Chryseobacterium soli TaxID=445961 RepID=A0A086A637_9FLAO|nr:cupin domain-containing protein [Chryseobacterium soli]KFF12151.1 cupin [Chryseobacterium soli]
MNHTPLEKSKVHDTVEMIAYVPQSVVSKTIIMKSTGSVSILSFDAGEGMTEKISPFDSFVQIVEGNAEIIIEERVFFLETGQCMIIPAHKSNCIKANERLKILITIIKSGYE